MWLYSATACLISVEELVTAANDFLKIDTNHPMLSVTKLNTPLEWALDINENGRLVPRNKMQIKKNSQDFDATYFDAGCFAIYRFDFFLESEIKLMNFSYRPFILPRHRAIDVDELEDMQLVETLFSLKSQILSGEGLMH